jgi:hypothetical protein
MGVIAIVLVVGCGKSRSPVESAHTRLGRLGLLYGMYASQHEGKPPTSLAQFQRFVEERISPDDLARAGAANASEFFTSPRDGQPYGFISLSALPVPAAGQRPPVVLYEQQGQDGLRMVGMLGGGTDELDAESFQKFVPISNP